MVEQLVQLGVTALSGLESTFGGSTGLLVAVVAGAVALRVLGLTRVLLLGGLCGLLSFAAPYLLS